MEAKLRYTYKYDEPEKYGYIMRDFGGTLMFNQCRSKACDSSSKSAGLNCFQGMDGKRNLVDHHGYANATSMEVSSTDVYRGTPKKKQKWRILRVTQPPGHLGIRHWGDSHVVIGMKTRRRMARERRGV